MEMGNAEEFVANMFQFSSPVGLEREVVSEQIITDTVPMIAVTFHNEERVVRTGRIRLLPNICGDERNGSECESECKEFNHC